LRNDRLRIKDELRKGIDEVLRKLCLEIPDYSLEFAPEDISGDFATNVALIAGSRTGKPSVEIADIISGALQQLIPKTIKPNRSGKAWLH